MITYEPFWVTLKRKNIKQITLIKEYKISSSQLGRLRRNCPVSTHTIEILCRILECGVDDIMRYTQDSEEGNYDHDNI